MNAETDLLVCIGNMGSYEHLGPCLRSIFRNLSASTPLSVDVMVGFNGFTDRSVIEQMSAEFPEVRWIHHPAKLGYTGIYNLLMETPGSRYVLVLDDDTTLSPDTLATMVRFMDEHPEVALAGCRVHNPDGSHQPSVGLFSTAASDLRGIVTPGYMWRASPRPGRGRWHSVEWIDGTFMLVRRAALQRVGGLDEFYFTFESEPDWALRFRRHGWQVAYVDTTHIVHIGGEHSSVTRIKVSSSLLRSYINKFYFYRKHYSPLHRLVLRPLIGTSALMRCLHYALVRVARAERATEAEHKFRGYARIACLAFSIAPWRLPATLQQQNDAAAVGIAALRAGRGHQPPTMASTTRPTS